MSPGKYLLRHGSGYRFQMAVPEDLRAIVGRKVWRRYLGVMSEQEAKRIAQRLAVGLHEKILDSRSGLSGVGVERVIWPTGDEREAIELGKPYHDPVEKRFDLNDLVEAWRKSRQPRSPRTVVRMARCVRFLREVTHARPIDQTTREDLLRVRDVIEAAGLAEHTARGYLGCIHSLFAAAVSEGLVSSNPAAGIRLRRQAAKFALIKGRQPFGREQVRSIFEHLRGEPKEFDWIVRLLAYHGMRSGEVVQLRKEDVGKEGEIVALRVHDLHGSIKNRSAQRDIPLHPHCRDFLAYVEQANGPWIFSPEHWRFDRFHRYASLFLRTKVGVRERHFTMHSFRHGWRTMAREVDMPPAVSGAIMGHTMGVDVHEAYGKPPSIAVLAEWMARVEPLASL